MKITAIKQQVKNQERASIFLDGKYNFSLSLNELIEEALKVNLEIDDQRLKNLKKKSDDGKLRMRALEWVLLRPHSVKEFKDYLKRKKAEPDLIDSLVREFQAKKYLDDEYFATWWVERRIRKNKSNRAIQAELMSKGVTAEIMSDGGEEKQRVLLTIQKISGRSRYQDEQKLKAYLVRQGFSYSLVAEVLSELAGTAEAS